MEIKLQKIINRSPANFNFWNKIAAESNEYTIAHNPYLGEILEKTFNLKYEPYFLKNKEEIIGVLPLYKVKNKLVSVPHFSYGGPIFNDYKYNDYTNSIIDYLNTVRYELRAFKKFSKYYNDDKITSFLYLMTDKDEQFSKFKSKLRSQIRKGYKNELVCKIGSAEYLKEFYEIYARNMKQLGSPVLPKKFFINLVENYKYGDVKVFVVYYGENAIGASIVLSYIDFMEVCWASTIRKYNSLSTNMVLYWEMIKYAINRKMKVFSFGRSTKGESTYRFKKQWGIQDKQLYFNFSEPQKINIKKFVFLATIWSKLPYHLTKKLGPIFSSRLY